MPLGNARYGVSMQGFTNANPCVLSVSPDPTAFMNVGDQIIVAACVSTNIGSQLNGKYLITNLTSTTVTIDLDATLFGVYVSGGFVCPEQAANQNPFNQAIFYKQFVPYIWTNLARGSGTSAFAADASSD